MIGNSGPLILVVLTLVVLKLILKVFSEISKEYKFRFLGIFVFFDRKLTLSWLVQFVLSLMTDFLISGFINIRHMAGGRVVGFVSTGLSFLMAAFYLVLIIFLGLKSNQLQGQQMGREGGECEEDRLEKRRKGMIFIV